MQGQAGGLVQMQERSETKADMQGQAGGCGLVQGLARGRERDGAESLLTDSFALKPKPTEPCEKNCLLATSEAENIGLTGSETTHTVLQVCY